MKTFKMVEFGCDFSEEIYGETIEEAIENHAIDQQYEVSFPCLAKEDNGEWTMYYIDVLDYDKAKYKVCLEENPIIKFVVNESVDTIGRNI